jgi:hypothetical protein
MGVTLSGTVTTEGGTPVAYTRCGKFPPLVVLLGTAGDSSHWRPVLPALEERFKITHRSALPHPVVLEGRGHGAMVRGTDLFTDEVMSFVTAW